MWIILNHNRTLHNYPDLSQIDGFCNSPRKSGKIYTYLVNLSPKRNLPTYLIADTSAWSELSHSMTCCLERGVSLTVSSLRREGGVENLGFFRHHGHDMLTMCVTCLHNFAGSWHPQTSQDLSPPHFGNGTCGFSGQGGLPCERSLFSASIMHCSFM